MAINILDKLKEFNVEVTADMEKAFKGEFISVDEHNKKVKRVEDERDNLQKNYDQAKATLDGFEGKDLAQIEKDRDEWKEKAENAEKEYKQALEKRDYADLIEKATAELKFTSNSAKKAFKAELLENPLPVKDGKLLGFDDFVKVYEESDLRVRTLQFTLCRHIHNLHHLHGCVSSSSAKALLLKNHNW